MKVEFDPRTKIFMLLLSPVILALDIPLVLEIIITLIYIAPFFLAGERKWGISFLIIYVLQLVIAFYVIPFVTSYFILYALSLLTNGLRRMMPSIISGTFAIKTTDLSEWISTFKLWKLPNVFVVPFSVMFRFFPTIVEDYRHIRQAMAFRGIGSGITDLLKHPIQTFEFIIIPLLMNASQVASDLTISALTKGLSVPGKHTSLVQLQMMKADWIMILVALAPVVVYLGGMVL